MTKEQWQKGVTIIDGIEVLSFKEVLHIVLHNWVLCEGGTLGSSGITLNAITKGKDVFIFPVL